MGALTYVCLYLSYNQTFAPFTNEERGRIMTAMLNYASVGEEPHFEGNERFIWPTIKAQMDRDATAYQEKCETNARNGKLGGRPRKQTVFTETERFLEEPKKAKEKENDKEKENAIEIENAQGGRAQSSSAFIPPTEEQIRQFCTEQNLSKTDSRKFFNYYSANGWKMGNAPMADWRAAARLWNDREIEKQSPSRPKHPPIPGVPTL